MESVFQLLNPDNTISVNRPLAHALGLSEAVVYAALLAKHEWYSQHDMLTDGWFYSTVDDLEESTALSRDQQSRCIKRLIEAGLIRIKKLGLPAKRFFYIVDSIKLLEKIIKKTCAADGGKKPAAAQNKATKQDVGKPDSKKSAFPTTSNRKNLLKTKVNKTRENKPELISQDSARAQIGYEELSRKYGPEFAGLAAEITAEGLSGAFTLGTDRQTIPAEKVVSVYKRVDSRAVSHVADYISGRNNIRNLRAYLRSALYTAAVEAAQRPRASGITAEQRRRRDILGEDIMDEIRRQYADIPPEPDCAPAVSQTRENSPGDFSAPMDIMDEIRRQYMEPAL